MAVLSNLDKTNIVTNLLNAYGIGVRAGVFTPCLQDENAFRAMLGLDTAPEEVVAQWETTNGVRLPITPQQALAKAEGVPDNETNPDKDIDSEQIQQEAANA